MSPSQQLHIIRFNMSSSSFIGLPLMVFLMVFLTILSAVNVQQCYGSNIEIGRKLVNAAEVGYKPELKWVLIDISSPRSMSDCRPPRKAGIEFWCKCPSESLFRLCREWEPIGTKAKPKCLAQDDTYANWTLPNMVCNQRAWSYIPTCHPVRVHSKSGKRGACVKPNVCPIVAVEEKKLEQPQICFHEGNIPLLSCPSARIVNQILVVVGIFPNFSEFGYNTAVTLFFNEKWYPKTLIPGNRELLAVSRGLTNKLIFVGGKLANNKKIIPMNRTDIYDFVEDKWTRGPSLNTERYFHYSVTIDNSVYVFGGYNDDGYVRTLEYMNFDEGDSLKWKYLAPSINKRAGAAAVVWKGDIFVVGGRGLQISSGITTVFATIEKYIVAENKWEELRNLGQFISTARWKHRLVVLDDKIYAIGGRDSNHNVLVSCESFDGNVWKDIMSMHVKRVYPAVGVLDGRVLYVVGGLERSKHGPGPSLEIYDPTTDKWTLHNDSTYTKNVVWKSENAIVLEAPHTMWEN